MTFDLHIHSKYSLDSISEVRDIIATAKRRGLNGIAITDHNTIKGAVEAKMINTDKDFVVIIGAEIATEIGDIIGLFLKEEITARNFAGVIEEIHRQGGIAVLPHPYKGHKLDDSVLEKIDVIEVFNSRQSEDGNRKAMKLAERYKKPMVAGSDAHFLSEIGAGRVIINSPDIRNEILNGKVELITNYTPSYGEFFSQVIKFIKSGEYVKIFRLFPGFMMRAFRRG
ncbi:hypothetical protein DRP53_08170 [candidate division WOR-3 bacterium]|uniref:Polymerase/histidinol phosphatase N-terminal domain-containing protein n=1 Tax=candidate division WOR-3 bacterium TaxID=2052148 RepID=A0A660SHF5_UNCW3|nr:MAG: hypothetical protein DRP53_08170 [candidate division WOR-3 bacterium]